MTTLYDNDSGFQIFDREPNSVSPQATRWLWGFLIFMVLMFFFTGVYSSNRNQKISEQAYLMVQKAKDAIQYNRLDEAKEIIDELTIHKKYGKNWSVLYLNALLAYEEGDIFKSKSFIDKIIEEDHSLSFADTEPGFLSFQVNLLDDIKKQKTQNNSSGN